MLKTRFMQGMSAKYFRALKITEHNQESEFPAVVRIYH